MSQSQLAAHILIVDDDATTRVYVAGLLRQQGYNVTAAGTGADGLAAAADRAPDLMLLDVMLPDADGFSICRQLRENPQTQHIPVIFLTAKGNEQEIVQGFESGGVDYVVKPFAVAVLLARVGTHATLSQLSRGLHLALDERSARLEQVNRRLRALNIEMATVEERQRRELAQELHDTTIQQLVLARILLEGGPDLQARRDQLLQLVQDAIRQLRSFVFELSPPLLRAGGLYPALEWLAEEVSAQWGLAVTCERDGELPALADALAVTLFQGARELLINAAKHAEARRATLRLCCDGDALSLCVADDGRGFDTAWLMAYAQSAPDADRLCNWRPPGVGADGGFGLLNLRARLELLGGCLRLSNSPQHGAEACIDVRTDEGAAAASRC